LFNIHSFGFRGEALASIAEISALEISTRRDCDALGTCIGIEAGIVKKIESIACSRGTTVEVKDLFFSVPVRRDYLKGQDVEFSQILKIVSKYALIKKHISIVLIHNGREVINSQKTNLFFNNVVFVLGVEVGKDLIEVDFEDSDIHISGFVSKPSLTRADKSEQSSYVNGRYVKDKTIGDAVYSAYKTLLFINRNPIFVLNVEIDAGEVDVNVHPNKELIKFRNEKLVGNIVYRAVQDALKKADLIREAKLNDNVVIDNEVRGNSVVKPTHKYEFSGDKQVNLFVEDKEKFNPSSNESQIDGEMLKENKPQKLDVGKIQNEFEKTNKTIQDHEKRSLFGKLNVLGQINKTFVICEGEDGLIIFDQHAAEERVNYERFMEEFYSGAIKKQRLLDGKVVELNPEQKIVAMNNIGFLESMGFEFDDFGGNSLKLSAVPEIFGRLKSVLFIDVLDELLRNKGEIIGKEIEERIIKFSCRASVKAGAELTRDEIRDLLKRLGECENPYSCPHGRPTIIRLSIGELEKKFKRTGW